MIVVTFCNLSLYLISMSLATYDGTKKQTGIQVHYLVIGWLVGVVVVIFWLLILNLILLHIYLWKKGLTTYQFILIQRQEERQMKLQFEKEKEKKEREKMKDKVQQQIVSQNFKELDKRSSQNLTNQKIEARRKTETIQSEKDEEENNRIRASTMINMPSKKVIPLTTQLTSEIGLKQANSRQLIIAHSRQTLRRKNQSIDKVIQLSKLPQPKIDKASQKQLKSEDSSLDNFYEERLFSGRNNSRKTAIPQFDSSNNLLPKGTIERRIFGEKQLTQKSQGQINDKELSSSFSNKMQEAESKNSFRNTSLAHVKLSQFFTRNKSLRYLIGKNDYTEPQMDHKKTSRLDEDIRRKSLSLAGKVNNQKYEEEENVNYQSSTNPIKMAKQSKRKNRIKNDGSCETIGAKERLKNLISNELKKP